MNVGNATPARGRKNATCSWVTVIGGNGTIPASVACAHAPVVTTTVPARYRGALTRDVDTVGARLDRGDRFRPVDRRAAGDGRRALERVQRALRVDAGGVGLQQRPFVDAQAREPSPRRGAGRATRRERRPRRSRGDVLELPLESGVDPADRAQQRPARGGVELAPHCERCAGELHVDGFRIREPDDAFGAVRRAAGVPGLEPVDREHPGSVARQPPGGRSARTAATHDHDVVRPASLRHARRRPVDVLTSRCWHAPDRRQRNGRTGPVPGPTRVGHGTARRAQHLLRAAAAA